MSTPGNRRGLERFGSLNNIRSNSYRERTLDLRNGMGSISTINFKNTLETGYARDSLSSFGNTFRARVLGVTTGVPSKQRYPEIFSSILEESSGNKVVKDYFLFFLRMEFDYFTPNPDDYCETAQQYAELASMQGKAISRVPADEFEPVGPGDIVEVYLPNQNSYDGALVSKVVIRNSADPLVPTGGGIFQNVFNTTSRAFSQYNRAPTGGNFSFSTVPSAGGITNTTTAREAYQRYRGVLTVIDDEGIVQHIKEINPTPGTRFPGNTIMEIISLTSKTPFSFLDRPPTGVDKGARTYVGAVRADGDVFLQHKGIDLFLGSGNLLYLPANMQLVKISDRVYGGGDLGRMDYGVSLTFRVQIGSMRVELTFREVKFNEQNPSARDVLRKSIDAFIDNGYNAGNVRGPRDITPIEFSAGEEIALTYLADPNRLGGNNRQFGGGQNGQASRGNDTAARIRENRMPGGDEAMLHLEARVNGVLTNPPAIFNLECLIDPSKPSNFATEEDLRTILQANTTGTNLGS